MSKHTHALSQLSHTHAHATHRSGMVCLAPGTAGHTTASLILPSWKRRSSEASPQKPRNLAAAFTSSAAGPISTSLKDEAVVLMISPELP